MKTVSLFSILLSTLMLTVFSACGGGGGGGGGGITVLPPPVQQPTTAVVKLATTPVGQMPATTVIAGYDVLVTLPSGVTLKSTTAPPQTDNGVVTATGAATGSTVITVYSAATSTLAGTVRIQIIAMGNGFNAGEFATVNCDIAAGHFPTAADFQQPTFAAFGWDSSGGGSNTDLTSFLTLTATAVVQ